jgi:hypothetical protein
MSNEFDIFEDDGELELPTMRGSANLDPQDYARDIDGRGSDILDDDLEEDTPSTPGRNPGAAAAPDIDGTSSWTIEDDSDGPGMVQTTYGAHPWGPGGSGGYRPHSQQRIDMDLSGADSSPPESKPVRRDSMHNEPEVINAVDVDEVPEATWHGNRNQMPSNRGIPSDTLYDRTSYEYNNSTQDTIGSGIFDMEEGVTWRPRDGSFANQYALPAYIADEDELGVQQSEMFDTTANEWRVVQPSAGGVPLKTRVSHLRKAYSPFVDGSPPPDMRAEVTGPRSHIEAFGRKVASLVMSEAKSQPGNSGPRFLANALESLGPNMSARAKAVADRMVAMGYEPSRAMEDVVAHCVMHAAVRDLRSSNRRSGALPSLDRLAGSAVRTRKGMQAAAVKHIAPLTRSTAALKSDLGSLYSSSCGRGMGQVATDAATTSAAPATVFTTRNLLIAAAVGGIAYLGWTNRKSIQRNAKKFARKVGL